MVLSEVLVTVGVAERRIYVIDSQLLTFSLTILVVFGAAVHLEVGRFMDKRSSLGISTGVGSIPESTAEVDLSELGRI